MQWGLLGRKQSSQGITMCYRGHIHVYTYIRNSTTHSNKELVPLSDCSLKMQGPKLLKAMQLHSTAHQQQRSCFHFSLVRNLSPEELLTLKRRFARSQANEGHIYIYNLIQPLTRKEHVPQCDKISYRDHLIVLKLHVYTCI